VVQKESRQLSVDELEQALELTDKNDIKNEQSMLQGIIRFGDETAKEVMTSRQDIVDLPINSSYEDVLKCIVDNNYSRIPVYQDNQDNIRGILYIKDLLPHLSKPKSFRWQSLIRPPYFVPETKMIDDLLRDFQENHVHMAIVVDEYGGTSGLVTLEDILEEIVGEINDEYDEEERQYVKLNYNTYSFEGKTLLSGSIRDNLRLGKLNATDEEMEEALRKACADFVFDLPDGLNTACTEQGGGLSEGQAQRIAIARALLRNRSIMLFDEATSALDPETERQLLANVLKDSDKTIIFVTHRMAVTDYCDQTAIKAVIRSVSF